MTADAHSPLAQFEVKTLIPLPQLFGVDVSFTNASLFMMLAAGAILLFLGLGMRRGALVPSRFQSMAELSYEFIADLIKDNVGKEGMRYFSLIFTLFMFILFCNLLGMIPYSFTVTSHIVVTFAFAALIFLGITLLAIVRHGPVKFLGYFLPAGVPLVMAPLMFFIEFFSYLARPMSLSIRLAANMMAGHTMLKVIGGFVIGMGILGGWAPLAFLVALTGFEFFVAVLQAYIFTILTCVYLHDAVHLH